MMIYQKTLLKKVNFSGIGIHSGKKVRVTLYPASYDFGVRFKRVDLPNAPTIKASVNAVGSTAYNTTLVHGHYSIHTVEHLLSVFYALEIDNIYCEIDGPEVPIMDGSGASFLFILQEVGLQTLNASKKFLIFRKSIEVKMEDRLARVVPCDSLIIDSTIVFVHPVIKKQRKVFYFNTKNYIEEIVRERTFGFLKDVDKLKRQGLIEGGSLDNAIVLNDFKILNREGVRFHDEFVRHKILDVIGDFSLLEYSIIGKIITYKSGHHLHNLLCQKILETPGAYEIIPARSLYRSSVDMLGIVS